MERSKFLNLNWRDLLKGLLMAVLSAVVTLIYELVQAGPITFDKALLGKVGLIALSTALAYLMKNLFENTEGELAKPELPKTE